MYRLRAMFDELSLVGGPNQLSAVLIIYLGYSFIFKRHYNLVTEKRPMFTHYIIQILGVKSVQKTLKKYSLQELAEGTSF